MTLYGQITNPHHTPDHLSLQAITPDQLLSYVHAVSAVETLLEQDFLVHKHGGHSIVVGYALQEGLTPTAQSIPRLQTLVQHLCHQEDVQRITLLAPLKPAFVPAHALCHEDAYYFLPLPLVQKNAHNALCMWRRALPHIEIRQDTGEKAWTGAHQELMLQYLQRPNISKEMGSIFQRLDVYCRTSPQVTIFSAYHTQTKELMGISVADFSSLHTAFYMFAFRASTALPGVSEALLGTLLEEATARGYAWCNLGLGIDEGIKFFKEKWGARPLLPLFECIWNTHIPEHKGKKSWWHSLWKKNHD